jgi:S-adenosylmethionine:tRNA ribosyltransferase-isomerase
MRTDEFDFVLPERLIAQHPPEQRGASRLLYAHEGVLEDCRFTDLLRLVKPGDVLVLNDTRVIKARLFGSKASGGKVEVLVERVLDDHQVLAQVRASHSPKAGSLLLLADTLTVEVLGREGEFFCLRFTSDEHVLALLERHGRLPLPPYIPMRRMRRMSGAIRPCSHAQRARWPLLRPACILTRRCCKPCATKVCRLSM